MKPRTFFLLILLIYIPSFVFISNFSVITLNGVSMEPNFHTGDKVLIWRTPIPKELIREGSIISFKRGENIVFHRVIEKNQKYVIAQGDNCEEYDFDKVSYSDIVGIYVFPIPLALPVVSFLVLASLTIGLNRKVEYND